MKHWILIISFSLFTFYSVVAQVVPSWISNGHFPDASASTATVVEVDQSGNILLGGTAEDNFVMKLSADGELLWLQTYDCEDTISEAPNTLCIDMQGNAYITFMKHTLGGTYWAIAVQKYSAANGIILWTTELPESQFNGFEWQVKPKFMTIDDNHLYVAGTKFETGTSIRDILSMKLDFDGNILWTATHSGNGTLADYSNAKSITVDINGNVYVAGDAWNASIDYCVVKYDPDGNFLWDAFLDDEINQSTDIAENIIVDDSENVYVTGYSNIEPGGKDILTAKYDQNGTLQWKQYYGNPDYRTNNAYYLAVTDNGDLLVGGYSAYEDPYPGSGKDYILLKYTPSGNLVWDTRYDYKNFLNDHPFDFDMGPEGNVYICGITMKSCYIYQFITAVKVNTQGEIEWDLRVPNLYGTPWEIAVIEEDRFVIAAGAFDTIQVNDATAIYYEPGTPPLYEADILDVYFESQISPPVIDYANQRVIATVHDTANIEFLVPYITRSEYSCMYPDDEVVTSFIEPIWYNITSFDDEIEKWWYVIVEGGYVGVEELESDMFQVYPNPVGDKLQIRYQIKDKRYLISDLFEISGMKIRGLVNEFKMPGIYEEVFDVSDLPAGIYFIRMQTGEQIEVKKFVVMN